MPVTIGNSQALLVDTPGFDDTMRTDSEILAEIARTLAAQYALGLQLSGVIYIHRITDVRYSRSAVKTFEIFKKICGLEALGNVLLVTSRWDNVDASLGAHRERNLKDKFWAYMISHGSNISRFYGDRSSAVSLVSQLLCHDRTVLQLQKELVDEGLQLDATSAGTYVDESLENLKQQSRDELASLQRLQQELPRNSEALERQIRLNLEQESSRVKALQEQQNNLRRPLGTGHGMGSNPDASRPRHQEELYEIGKHQQHLFEEARSRSRRLQFDFEAATQGFDSQGPDQNQQIESVYDHVTNRREDEYDRNVEILQHEFPGMDGSLISAIYGDSQGLDDTRELLEELNRL